MCGCSTRQSEASRPVERDGQDLSLRVEDMTCGHCAGAITKAIETGLPGTTVEADPSSKTVTVRGTTDLASVRALVSGAGYTPSAA
jgi:copper chaperone